MHLVVNLLQRCAFRCAHRRWRMCRAGKSLRQIFLPAAAGFGNGFCDGHERLLEKSPNLVVSGFFRKNFVTRKNPARVGVDHEDRMIAGVQQDGIGCFGADSMQVEQFFRSLSVGRENNFVSEP